MERNILVLDKNTIDKIAAGEVVERPVSVVKELVENSIDSNAKAITVEIKDGGTSFIRVTDNGCGIKKSEVKTAFLRHATSKIRTVEDLINVGSLGFRGEALSSIAAVSKVELLTKTEDEFTGTRYCIEGSREMSFDDVGVPEGTTFIVRALFYNTPARRKFLKTPQTEGSYVSDYMEKVMLSHPGIAFKLIINGNTRLQSSGNGEIPDIIYGLYGRDMVNGLLPIDITDGDITIRGYVCKPELSRGNRSFEVYYVNNRYIQSTVIRRALDEAYKPYLMLHKYPVVFLYIDISPELIDVNVHPAKKEIRFLEGAQLYDLLVNGIQDVLSHKELIPDMHEEKERNKEKDNIAPERTRPEPFETQSIFGFDARGNDTESSGRRDDDTGNSGNVKSGTAGYIDAGSTPDYVKEEGIYRSKHTGEYRTVPAYMDITAINVSDDTDTNVSVNANTYDDEKENGSNNSEEDEKDRHIPGGNEYEQLSMFEHGFLSEEGIRKHRIIGQLFETYWLVEMDNKLYIIDQHAAHEKIKYERLIRQFAEGEVHSQMLNPPIIVTLSMREEAVLCKYSDNFRKVGFEIEQFGGNEYSIREIPTELFGLRADEYFHDLMDELMNDKQSVNIDAIDHRIATMACKSAVKGNNRISYEEAAALIDELLTLDNPFNCPHGRPTIISFTKNEVEKMFKRIVT